MDASAQPTCFLKDGHFAALRVLQKELGPEVLLTIDGDFTWSDRFQNDDALRRAVDHITRDFIARGWRMWSN